jgi:hypothetical protein
MAVIVLSGWHFVHGGCTPWGNMMLHGTSVAAVSAHYRAHVVLVVWLVAASSDAAGTELHRLLTWELRTCMMRPQAGL